MLPLAPFSWIAHLLARLMARYRPPSSSHAVPASSNCSVGPSLSCALPFIGLTTRAAIVLLPVSLTLPYSGNGNLLQLLLSFALAL